MRILSTAVLACWFLALRSAPGATDTAIADLGGAMSVFRQLEPPLCAPAPGGLVALWHGDGNGKDAMGAFDARLSGDAMFASGLVGQAFQFNGTLTHEPSAFRVEVPPDPALSPQANDPGETGLAPDPRSIGEMSVQAWIRIPALPIGLVNEEDPKRYVVRKLGSLGWEYGLFIATNGQAGFVVYRFGSEAFEARGGNVTTNQWHFLAGTYKKDAFVRIYLDGVQVGELPPPLFHSGSVTSSDLLIGHGGLFDGLIDEIALFRRALSGPEIQTIYQAGPAGMCSPVRFNVGVLGVGGVMLAPPQPAYLIGDTVTLTATNGRDHRFLQWNDGNTNDSRTVTAGLTNNYVAIFTNTLPLETLLFKQWDRSFGGVEFDNYPIVRHTLDGGYVLAGATASGVGGNKTTPLCGTVAAWIVKLDAEGNKQWEQTVGAPGESLYLVSLTQTADGGYALGASATAASDPLVNANCGRTSAGFGSYDFWLVRLDASGHRLWDASFGGDGVDVLGAVESLGDGGFIMAGGSSSGVSGNKTSANFGTNDYWVVRVDAGGNKLWDRSFGGTEIENAFAVVARADGGFLVSGISSSGISGNKTASNYGSRDYWCIRLDAGGNKLWDHCYGGSLDESGAWMASMPDGGAVLAGYSDSLDGGTRTAPNRGDSDYWVVRIDADGNQLWDRSFGGSGVYDWAYNVKATADGGVIVVGESDSDVDGNKTTAQIGNSDGWVVRIDPWGGKLSEASLGGTDYDYLWSVDTAGPDAFIFAGGSYSDPGGNKTAPRFGEEDFWLVRMVERTAPVGTPTILINGRFSATNSFFVTNSALVSIQTTFSDGHIYYTLMDAPPGTGPAYSGPFVVEQSLTVRAIAYNADYSQSAEADPVTITIVRAPAITLQPESAVVRAGTDVLLLVEAAGAAPLAYQWFFNGGAIGGATNSFLLRANLQLAETGAYQAVASNPYGSATSTVAGLSVLAPPGIVAQPSTTNIDFGQAVTFCVSVIGSEPFAFQWRRNGVNLVGQTNSCLSINAVARSDGGSYTVVVRNSVDAVTSDPARLLLNVPAPPSGDQFTNATPLVTDIQGTVRGTNRLATSEPGEPPHGPGAGGRTVWYKFISPGTSGFVFDTIGSTFDTVLAIYTGSNVAALTLVANDDDSGGFHTSRVGFTRTTSVYYIAVDGFGDESGEFILRWQADVNLPVIQSQPASQSVTNSGTASFGVTATGTATLLYQWQFNDVDLTGETNAQLVIANVQPANVGRYRVRVRNSGLGSVLSVPAVLEIGPVATLYSVDRVEELLTPFGSLRSFQPASGGSSVTVGSLGTQLLNTTNSTTSFRETNHCGIIGGASRWFKLTAATNATFVLDTDGSAFDTVLAVYIGDALINGYPTKFVGCNDDASPAVKWSRVAFSASNGVDYVIAVDGVGGASGPATLNWWLGNPPTPGPAPPPVLTPVVREGTNLTLMTTLTNGPPPPHLQWYRDQTQLGNATNATLFLNNVQLVNAGTYRVVASNAIGTITSIVARVTVDVPLNLGVITVTKDGRSFVQVSGIANQGFIIQGSTNFANWIPIYTNAVAAQRVNVDDRSATNRPRRFYRAVPWP